VATVAGTAFVGLFFAQSAVSDPGCRVLKSVQPTTPSCPPSNVLSGPNSCIPPPYATIRLSLPTCPRAPQITHASHQPRGFLASPIAGHCIHLSDPHCALARGPPAPHTSVRLPLHPVHRPPCAHVPHVTVPTKGPAFAAAVSPCLMQTFTIHHAP